MKTRKPHSVRDIAKLGVAVVMFFFASQSAIAGPTAANHIVRNTVTVNYEDLGGASFTDTKSVDITIDLLEAAPDAVLSVTQVDSFNPVSPGQIVSVVYTVTSNANGEDEYTLTSGGLTLGAGVLATAGSDVVFVLGATSVAQEVTAFQTSDVTADSGTDISVPADSVNADGILNGITVGEMIVLDMSVGGDNVCTVNKIEDGVASAEANGVVTIEVDNCSQASGTLSVGDQIGERQEVTLGITITAGSGSGTVTVDMNVDYTGGNTPAAVNNTVITVVEASLSIYKFVRNMTSGTSGNAGANSCTTAFSCLQLSGITYYSSGVTALPGEELEYIVLLYNNAGKVQNAIVTDPFVTFTTYKETSIQVIPETTANDNGGACSAGATGTCVVSGGLSSNNADDLLTSALDFGGVNADVITVYAGTGADESTVSGGEINADKVAVVRYVLVVD